MPPSAPPLSVEAARASYISKARSKPPHEHPLILIDNSSMVMAIFRCDLCQSMGLQSSFSCFACSYDECEECFVGRGGVLAAAEPAVARELLVPKHEHPLLFVSNASHPGQVGCDTCRRAPLDEASYTCPLCSFDECPSCYVKRGGVVVSSSEPVLRSSIVASGAAANEGDEGDEDWVEGGEEDEGERDEENEEWPQEEDDGEHDDT